MNQDDEFAPRFTEFGDQAMAATTPAGSEAVRRRRRVQALAAGAATVAVLVAGGTWLVLHRDSSPGHVGAGSSPASSPVQPAQGAGSSAGSPVTSSAAAPPGDGGPAAPSGDGGPAAAAPPGEALPRCRTGDLAARLEAGGGAAGSVYLDLGLTNRSAHPCRVYGFPGMTLIDSAGRWIPTTLRRDATQPKLFTLAPEQTAWAVVHYAHIPADDEGTPCQPAAVGLAVTPPDETTQLTINAKLEDVCQHGQLATSAMTDRRGGG